MRQEYKKLKILTAELLPSGRCEDRRLRLIEISKRSDLLTFRHHLPAVQTAFIVHIPIRPMGSNLVAGFFVCLQRMSRFLASLSSSVANAGTLY